MDRVSQWKDKIFNIDNARFEPLALEIFNHQSQHNKVYKDYLEVLGIDARKAGSISAIPFLPIRLFKSQEVKTGSFEPEQIFESSGTTGMASSKHLIKDLSVYEESFTRCFELFYGPVTDHCILGLLPSYLERGNSSLVYMVDRLIRKSRHPLSDFYLDDFVKLRDTLTRLEKQGQKTILIGVSFALLDFSEQFPMELKHTIIVETGGMKGRKKELIREDLHNILKARFHKEQIHAEYGMTELLSQAWSMGAGIFQSPPWMKIMVRDEEDPMTINSVGSGVLNIIDLANIHSCCFIATEDAGRVLPGGDFEVLGRIDNTDLRGCSLLLA